MNKRLFSDNGGETLTADGHVWSKTVESVLHPLMTKALAEGISIRDLTFMVVDEIATLSAEVLIRKGIEMRKKHREGSNETSRKTFEKAVKSD